MSIVEMGDHNPYQDRLFEGVHPKIIARKMSTNLIVRRKDPVVRKSIMDKSRLSMEDSLVENRSETSH